MTLFRGVKNEITVKCTAEFVEKYDRITRGKGKEPIVKPRMLCVDFDATFKKLKVDELKTFFSGIVEALPNSDALDEIQETLLDVEDAEALGDEDIMQRWLLDWTMPSPEEDGFVEFNAENVHEALQVPEYRKALVKGFFMAQFNRESLQAGNLSTPAATGRRARRGTMRR